MRGSCTAWLIVLLLGGPVLGGLFDRKTKPEPAERVAQLLLDLKSESDAGKRARAAEDLREFEVATYPEIVPALITALRMDSSSQVRREAAQSLGRVRPKRADVAAALDQAATSDQSYLVRLQARTSRMGYRPNETAGSEGGKAAPKTTHVSPPSQFPAIQPLRPLPKPPVKPAEPAKTTAKPTSSRKPTTGKPPTVVPVAAPPETTTPAAPVREPSGPILIAPQTSM